MKTVLVTGISGFIGGKAALYFLEKGYNVVGWSRLESYGLFKIKRISMLDKTEILNELNVCKPDIIIHCAGSADVGRSFEDPDMDYEGNVTITHNLLFAIYKLGMVKTRFIYLSSAGVYGNPISLPISEEMPLNPLSPYAVHKVMCEELCKYFVANHGMDIKIARIFSAYGEGLKKQIFWDMYNKAKKTGELEMFGTGNESRDYIHIKDVVKALYLIATTESEYTVFNVANGEEITIRKVTELFAKEAGINISEIKFNGIVREGDPLNWKADIYKMKGLGYKKSVQIENGINLYFKWARSL